MAKGTNAKKKHLILMILLLLLGIIFLVSFGEPYYTNWREKQVLTKTSALIRALVKGPDLLYGPVKHSIYSEVFGFALSLFSVGVTFAISQVLHSSYKWGKNNAQRVALCGALVWVFISFNWISKMPVGFIAAAVILLFLGANKSKKWFPALVDDPEKNTSGLLLGYTSLFILNGFFWWPGYQLFVALGISGLVVGDNLAAIFGRKRGKHKIRFTKGKKTIEGVAVMFAATFLFNIIIAYLMIHIPGMHKFLFRFSIIFLAATVSTVAELFSPKGWDNLIIGPATAFPLYFYIH